ncbi:MAG: 1-acyl-sn-glycerol-3-phosphate acyltransferase [Bacteroidetes bacterium]|nr:1-acyl-sn-glycerol-3-phosphate acyltransferase [Bacteroidota bacterium]
MADKFIDIEKVIASKNPKLLKWLPGFLLRYIKRILHEKDVNAFMAQNGHLKNFEFVRAVLEEFGVTLVVKGLENIPATGKCIIAANHPLGGLDGLALMEAAGQKRPDIQFLVNDILMNLKSLDELFVPVNKHGAQYAMDSINNAYASDRPVLIFPAGLVSRKQENGIEDLVWKKSFITQSQRNQSPIVPTFIEGKNSKFFYNIEVWRRRLGIKANIGMFYLVDEMYKQKGKTITIIFGKPVMPETLTPQISPVEWSARLKAHVYAIGSGKHDLEFKPAAHTQHASA